MTFRLSKQFRFEAAHHLPDHDGKCRRVHGHSWVGTVTVRRDTVDATGPKAGMVMDYADMKAVIQPIIDEALDHWDLNATLPLRSPTSEAIAAWLFDRWAPPFFMHGVTLESVTIEETCTTRCEVRA